MVSHPSGTASNQTLKKCDPVACPEVRSFKRKFCDRVHLRREKCKKHGRRGYSETDQKTHKLGSMVVSITARHAGDRGSIPRRGARINFSAIVNYSFQQKAHFSS